MTNEENWSTLAVSLNIGDTAGTSLEDTFNLEGQGSQYSNQQTVSRSPTDSVYLQADSPNHLNANHIYIRQEEMVFVETFWSIVNA